MNADRRCDSARRTLLNAFGAFALGSLAALASAQQKERSIGIVARKFDFVPDEIHVGVGENVIIELTAPEVTMGFNLVDFGLRTDIVPGRTATLRLAPDKTGTFYFHCDVFCGSGHEEMSGTLVVS
jgi:cytochrome c oxidase subunit 2